MSKWNAWKEWLSPALGMGVLLVLAIGFGDPEQRPASRAKERVRVAYLANVSHAPAMAATARGTFQQALPPGVAVDVKVFNAGPEEMEALLAGEVDFGYVGPSPAINTYLKSGGKAVRILAGVCSGGAALVARGDVDIRSIDDLDGKRLAIPQIGGTQDVSARHFLASRGLQTQEKGGTVQMLPVKNPDILALFLKKELDAAWVPEPWASRLIQEAGARLVLDERDLWPGRRFTTNVVVARTSFLEKHPDRVQALLQAHLSSIQWLQENPKEGQEAVNGELKRLTGKALPARVLQAAWTRVDFSADPHLESIGTFVQAARTAGYLPPQEQDMAGLFHLELLEKARRSLTAFAR